MTIQCHVKEATAITRGIYTAATGMIAEDAAQEVIAQNLANVSTTGYKLDVPVFKSFEENLIAAANDGGDMPRTLGSMGNGTEFQIAQTDFSQGALKSTSNPLDVAMTGNAFLSVQTAGGTRYTRDGALSLTSNGTLVTASNAYPVLNAQGGTITLPSTASSVSIDDDGTVHASGQVVGKIGLVSITMANGPQKIGDNLISTSITPSSVDPTTDSSSGLRDGYLEQSNVNIVKEMVTMIACQRAYEANEKTLKSHDEVEQQAVSDVGKVA